VAGTRRSQGDPLAVQEIVNRGLARYEQHDYARAIQHFTTAIALAPYEPDAYFHRGNAHRYAGDLDAAIADYGAAIRRDPSFAMAYYNRAMARKLNSDIAGAIADLEQYLEVCAGLCPEDRTEVEQSVRDLRRILRR
jgi:tetratricopeptide (TPR) repeat protein